MSAGPLIFDRMLLRARRRRAWTLGPATFLLDRVAEDLGERLSAVLRQFDLALDLGAPSDAVARVLAASGKVGQIIAGDVSATKGARGAIDFPLAHSRAGANPETGSSLSRGRAESCILAADEEMLPFGDATLDLVVSALTLQFVNDLPGTLVQIRRALKPDGLFLAALMGGDTLTELRQAFAAAESEVENGISPRVAPFADLRELGALLQRTGFALPVTDVERLTVRYDSPFALMQDLRRMGATNALVERSRRPLRRATLMRMAQIYGERFADSDGRIRATFDVVWLSGWAPHESQQKPLRPGSAQRRLADALRTTEIPAGEKAKRRR
jgi:SAM-dependent methyltransferase